MRQIAQVVAGARAKAWCRGTPQQIADHMEQWFREEAADGFNMMPPYPAGRARRFRRAGDPRAAAPRPVPHRIRGPTLREHLGLPRPPSRYAKAASPGEQAKPVSASA